jgi:hypothetical protein
MSLLGKIFERGLDADDVVLTPRKQFTKEDVRRIAERGCTEFRRMNMNLLSGFGPLEGEFGVYSTLSNYFQTKSPLTQEINEALADGDEIALTRAFIHAMEFSFVTLYEKGALKRLQLIADLPDEAVTELKRMQRAVGPKPKASVVPVLSPAPTTPVIAETPIEICVREFRELPSSAWKQKWLNDRRNRPITDQAFAEGRI